MAVGVRNIYFNPKKRCNKNLNGKFYWKRSLFIYKVNNLIKITRMEAAGATIRMCAINEEAGPGLNFGKDRRRRRKAVRLWWFSRISIRGSRRFCFRKPTSPPLAPLPVIRSTDVCESRRYFRARRLRWANPGNLRFSQENLRQDHPLPPPEKWESFFRQLSSGGGGGAGEKCKIFEISESQSGNYIFGAFFPGESQLSKRRILIYCVFRFSTHFPSTG